MSFEMDSPGWDGCPQLGRMPQGGFEEAFLKVPLHIMASALCQSPPCCWEPPQPPLAVLCESCFPASTRQRQSRHTQECPLSTSELSASRCLLVGIHQRVWPLCDRLWQAGSWICCGSCWRLRAIGHHHLQRQLRVMLSPGLTHTHTLLVARGGSRGCADQARSSLSRFSS